ncbi:hypothetical protein M0802_006604 [Mischocyttarus mexicanus]|nr:hypothetical protein M0802_006604 [Mischocyttarus mexicanus]
MVILSATRPFCALVAQSLGFRFSAWFGVAQQEDECSRCARTSVERGVPIVALLPELEGKTDRHRYGLVQQVVWLSLIDTTEVSSIGGGGSRNKPTNPRTYPGTYPGIRACALFLLALLFGR